MAIDLNVTVLEVDTHDQAEFLHLIHQVGVALRLAAQAADITQAQRDRLLEWREALRNHAGTDLAERPDWVDLLGQALRADFLRVNLTETGDQATPAPGLV